MRVKALILIIVFILAFVTGSVLFLSLGFSQRLFLDDQGRVNVQSDKEQEQNPHPLSIEALKRGNFEGSEIKIEDKLVPGSNYSRYLASYQSDGLKIYSLLTVPQGEKTPTGGWPVIIFNHGYIPPKSYQTTERYVNYIDSFARQGYLVFKPDYRGHGNSEGEAVGAYGSNAYTIDVLNALAAIKRYPEADAKNIGMWGHSLGGFITLRNLVVSKDIKAAVIWAGVVASYPDLLNNWRRRPTPAFPLPSYNRSWRQNLVENYGTPEQNPNFWSSLSANSYLKEIVSPIQLHHGIKDSSVPFEFSQNLAEQLNEVQKTVELYSYPNDDHNLSQNFSLAMARSVEFFDKYLKKQDQFLGMLR